MVTVDVAHEEHGEEGRREKVGGLVHREERTAVEHQNRVESLFEIPVGLPLVHKPDEKNCDRAKEEAVVDKVVVGAISEKVFGSEDTPKNRCGIIALGLERQPCSRVFNTGKCVLSNAVNNNTYIFFVREMQSCKAASIALTHQGEIDEWPQKSTPDLAPEHFALRDLHVEAELVIGDEVEVLFQNLTTIDHACQDCHWLSWEKRASNDFAEEGHTDLHVGNAKQNAVGEGEDP